MMREPHRWLLLIGTGTSVDLDSNLGMTALAQYLLDSISPDTEGWEEIAKKLGNKVSLEAALTKINPSEILQSEIAKYTAGFVAQKDALLRDDVLTGKKKWVGESLLSHLMRGLSPSWPCLPLVTPNYDMLIEYSCSNAGMPYITGYHGGIVRSLDWKKARERQYRLKMVSNGKKRSEALARTPRVELMKVHGSINLFRDLDGTFVENDLWAGKCPNGYTPVIAPPGVTKTLETLNSHQNLFGAALASINKATSYFAIGYGFNDPHIHQDILKRVREYDFPLIVLTRDSTDKLDELVGYGENVWVVTGKKDDPSGSRIVNQNKDLCGDFDGVELWKSDVFAKQILGG